MRSIGLGALAVVVAGVWAVLPGCPRAGPGPQRPSEAADGGAVPDAGAPEAVVEAAVEAVVMDAAPATALNVEGPRVADPRFAPSPFGPRMPEGTPPTIVSTPLPEGGRDEPPDIGAAASAALQAQFGCQTLGQLSWPASWLSPMGVVLQCCNQAADRDVPADAFRSGCLLPFRCSLLVDEGMGAITKVETVMALRQRVAPVRDPRTALAVVDATVRDVVPLLGDREEEKRFVREGPWRYVAETVTGTRVVERPGGGWDVTTFVVAGCGCHHDLVEVVFYVDELAGVTEQSRSVVIEDRSGVCVD